MNLLITICARGGSKGIPGKNIKELNGKPLIAYSIQAAQKIKENYKSVDVALSTDSDEIKKIAETNGLFSDYQRPDFLATDKAGKIDTIKDLLIYQEKTFNKLYDFIIDLDVTSPLRTFDDIDSALQKLLNDTNAINIFSVSKAHRNPYFNMVEENSEGYYALVKRPEAHVLSRQSAPKVFDLNASFYIYRKSFFDKGYKSAITDKSLVYEMPHICFDLDEQNDFEYLDFLIAHGKLLFSF